MQCIGARNGLSVEASKTCSLSWTFIVIDSCTATTGDRKLGEWKDIVLQEALISEDELHEEETAYLRVSTISELYREARAWCGGARCGG